MSTQEGATLPTAKTLIHTFCLGMQRILYGPNAPLNLVDAIKRLENYGLSASAITQLSIAAAIESSSDESSSDEE